MAIANPIAKAGHHRWCARVVALADSESLAPTSRDDESLRNSGGGGGGGDGGDGGGGGLGGGGDML